MVCPMKPSGRRSLCPTATPGPSRIWCGPWSGKRRPASSQLGENGKKKKRAVSAKTGPVEAAKRGGAHSCRCFLRRRPPFLVEGGLRGKPT